SRLVGEVLRGNLDVRSARARVSAARSDRVRSLLDLTPSATLAAGYSRQRLSTASFPGALGGGVFPDQSVWDAGMNASWDLDLFGGIRHTVQARGALAEVAQEDLRNVQVTPIGTPEAVVRYRPDVASAERFAAAQGALVGAVKASYLPRLTIAGSAGYAAPEFNSVGNQGTLRYVVGPVITWPGLNLGRV